MSRPRLLTEKCATCIFRSGNPMRLRPGRLRDMVTRGIVGGGITCHSTLSYGAHPDFGEAMCRGFYDAHGPATNFVRVIERIGGFEQVPPPVNEETGT